VILSSFFAHANPNARYVPRARNPQLEPVVDLLLSEMRMPGSMNGLALAQRLLDAKPSLKVIIMSGYSTEMPASAGRRLEFSYLAKPFELGALTATVRTCLDERGR
jgi:DNA-binding NtrC family response regulator